MAAPTADAPERIGTEPPDARPVIAPEQILVAIPALNEERHIERCLRSLLEGPPELARVKVVIADGGSTDRTREIADGLRTTFPNVSVVDNPGRLQSSGVNRAVALGAEPRHRVLVRCDAHAEYPPRYVLRVAESLVRREVAALATPMDSRGSNCFSRGAAWAVDTKLGSGGSAHRGGRVSGYVDHGHHAGFDLAWYRRVGGYVDGYAQNQDAELDHRIRKAGGRIWLDADIRLEYHMRPTLRKLARQYWLYGRGRARTVFTHRLVPRPRQMIPAAAFLVNVVALALAVMVAPVFLAVPALYAAVLAAASVWLAVAHRSPCGLWAGPALGAMHMAWGAGFLWHALTRGAKA